MTGTDRSFVHSAMTAVPVAAILFLALFLSSSKAQAADEAVNWMGGSTSVESDVPNQTPYIVGGNETTFDKHPWLVQITLNGSAFCGGALVHPMLVLTAAHCLWNSEQNNWWANLGTMQTFTSRTNSGTGGEELAIADIGAASNYNPSNGENDYGLIALQSASSRPNLKLAGPGEQALWRPGRTALVAGFGNIAQGGAASPVLKQLSVPLLSDSVCGDPTSYGAAFRSANMLCAGIVKGGSGTCQGDSGGPLTVPIDGGGRRIVGVVSWGDGCAKPNKPTLFTRVGEPGVSTQINALAATAAQALNFPGQYADSNIVGSGAKPAGCKAANGKAKTATTKANKAAKTVKKAKAGLKKAQKRGGKALTQAKKKLTAATKQSNSAKKAAKSAATAAKAACN